MLLHFHISWLGLWFEDWTCKITTCVICVLGRGINFLTSYAWMDQDMGGFIPWESKWYRLIYRDSDTKTPFRHHMIWWNNNYELQDPNSRYTNHILEHHNCRLVRNNLHKNIRLCYYLLALGISLLDISPSPNALSLLISLEIF